MLLKLAHYVLGGPVYDFVNGQGWLWPFMETTHFVGMSLLIGSLLVVDLRMAGHFRSLDLIATHKLLPVAFIGFGLNLVTGVLFFCGDPMRYAVHAGFQLKMILVIVAGLNALLYYWKIKPGMGSWDPEGDSPMLARVVAYVSLATWTGVLLLGRLIPYVSTG